MGSGLVRFLLTLVWFLNREIGSIKKIFNMTTLEDNECVPMRGRAKAKPLMSKLVDV